MILESETIQDRVGVEDRVQNERAVALPAVMKALSIKAGHLAVAVECDPTATGPSLRFATMNEVAGVGIWEADDSGAVEIDRDRLPDDIEGGLTLVLPTVGYKLDVLNIRSNGDIALRGIDVEDIDVETKRKANVEATAVIAGSMHVTIDAGNASLHNLRAGMLSFLGKDGGTLQGECLVVSGPTIFDSKGGVSLSMSRMQGYKPLNTPVLFGDEVVF